MKRQYKFNEGIDQATKEKHLKVMCGHVDMYMRDAHHIGDVKIDQITITDHRGSTNIVVHPDRIEVSMETFITDDPLPNKGEEPKPDSLNDFCFTGAGSLWI